MNARVVRVAFKRRKSLQGAMYRAAPPVLVLAGSVVLF